MAFNEKLVAGSIAISDDRSVKVRVIEVTGGRNEYTALDIRQFGDGDYTGPTKKGVLVAVDHLDELIAALVAAKAHIDGNVGGAKAGPKAAADVPANAPVKRNRKVAA